MYSTYSKSTSNRGGGKGKSVKSFSGTSEIISMSGLDVAVKPVLDMNTVLCNNILAVKGILTEKCFIVDHEELKEDLVVKSIHENENVQQWIDIPSHTNVVTWYDQFEHDKNMFQLTEYCGPDTIDMYKHIDKNKLNLALQVPKEYLELIYDCTIQLAIGLEFLHDNNTVHGALNLSNVLMIKDDDNPIFKINNIKHGSVTNTPLNIEANQWPFTQGKKKGFSANDKKEILMLKDIYSLGICLLEMMIGRVSENQYSITIDSLPLTWAELPESTALIQVLVECLNIDSISQRKGKLNNVKKILIKEYKKSFQKSFYKYEHIFTTEYPDILNKKAVFYNFRGNDTIAVKLWDEAITMKKTHQDSVLNLLFHKWKSAMLTDQEVIQEIENVEAIQEKDNTYILKALFMIAVGEKHEGLVILKKILQGAKSLVNLEESKDNMEDMLVLNRETSKDEELTIMSVKSRVTPMFHRIQLEKDRYYQNQMIKTEHSSNIWHISISSMSRFMTTASQESVIVWSLKSSPKKIVKVNIDEPEIETPTVCCVDPKCSILYVHRRNDNKIMRFEIDIEEETAIPQEPIICPKEMNREILDSLAADDSSFVSEMCFINEGKFLRLVQYEADSVRFADYDFDTKKFSVRTGDKYEDRGIFKYGLTYVQHHDTLNDFIKNQEANRNIIVFPEKDFESVIVLENESDGGKNFIIYDVFNERIKRRITKDNLKTVFAVQHDSQFLAYSSGKNFVVYSLEVPEDIDEFIKPIYYSKDHQRNPYKIVQEKDKLWSKIMSLMKTYKKKKSRKFLIRIRKMMYKCFDNPVLLSFNTAFMTLYKTLIQDDKDCQRIDIIKLHKTMVFNDIKFSNDMHKIRNISMPSNPDNNYMLFSIDGVIHKYDVSTKEWLFSFKASAYRTMQIYDNDHRIITCDSSQIKIWSFDNDSTELITSLQLEDKLDKVYVPHVLSERAKMYYIVTFQDKSGFKVYKDKLVEHWHSKDGVHITCVDFTIAGDAFLAGTTDGRLWIYDFKDKSTIGSVDIGDGSAIKEIWVMDDKFVCVASDQPAVFVWPLGDHASDPYKLDTNPNKIACMKTSWGRKMLIIGYDDDTIEFWMYKGSQRLELLKEIKEDFLTFEVDSLCSSMLILNPKGRDIEYHVIEWEWDTQAIDKDLQNINLDFENIKPEDIEDSEEEEIDKDRLQDGKKKIKGASSGCCSIF